MRSYLNRIHHILYLVLGVLSQWYRQGIGYRLMTEVTDWAQSHAIGRMELNVDVRNTGAIELYEKMGFQVEGLRRRARRFGDLFVDEHTMGEVVETESIQARERAIRVPILIMPDEWWIEPEHSHREGRARLALRQLEHPAAGALQGP